MEVVFVLVAPWVEVTVVLGSPCFAYPCPIWVFLPVEAPQHDLVADSFSWAGCRLYREKHSDQERQTKANSSSTRNRPQPIESGKVRPERPARHDGEGSLEPEGFEEHAAKCAAPKCQGRDGLAVVVLPFPRRPAQRSLGHSLVLVVRDAKGEHKRHL